MRETAGVPGDPTQAVSLDRSVGVGEHAPVMGGDPTPDVPAARASAPSSAELNAHVIGAEGCRMDGIEIIGCEGLTVGEVLQVWGLHAGLAGRFVLALHPRKTVHVRELLVLVAKQRDEALARMAVMVSERRMERMMNAARGNAPNVAGRADEAGAPLERDVADDPTAAPQGGTDTAPGDELPAGAHGPTGAPTSQPNVTVNVVLNGSVCRPDELTAMLDALAQYTARRGGAR